MLIDFFCKVRDYKVPCTLRELLDLLRALEQGVVFANIDDFYFLARTIMVKDETQFDKFDKAFAHYFEGIENIDLFEQLKQQNELPADWLRKEFEKHLTEEEKQDFQMALDIDVYFSDDAETSWAKMKEAVKVSLFKPEILRVHGLKEVEGFDFKKYFTEYSMSNQDWIVKMREAATTIPDKIARSSTGVGTPDDVIEIFERFLKAGVNHFVIRFWGSNYFGSIDKFASKVIPYFKDQEK